jgi:hypothetical protein
VTGGDLNSARRTAHSHEQGNRRRGTGLRREPNRSAGGGHDLGGDARESFGTKSSVVSDDDSRARFFRARDVARDGVRDDADIFVGEVLGDDRAPTVGAEPNGPFGRCRRTQVAAIRQGLLAFF